MPTTTKKAYIYKMKLLPANILSFVILILLFIFSLLIKAEMFVDMNISLLLLIMVLYLFLHEVCHGIGYIIGGADKKNVAYGMCLEKGVLYCMCYQELTKKNILISLQMPFMVLGVVTYLIGYFCHIPLLILLSIVNLVGASMDLMMFLYIRKIKDVIYSESGEPDQFILISSEDLTKKKSKFLEIVDVKDYKKSDYKFKDIKKITISKYSLLILAIIFIISIL